MNTTSPEVRGAGPPIVLMTLALAAGIGGLGFMVGSAWLARRGTQAASGSSAIPPEREVAQARRALRDVQRRLDALERREDPIAERDPPPPASSAGEAAAVAAEAVPVEETPELAERRHQAELAAFRDVLASVEVQSVDEAWAPEVESAILEETRSLSGVDVAVACRSTLCRLDVTFASREAEQAFSQSTLELSAFRDTTFTEHLIRDEQGRIVRSEVVLARQGHDLPPVDVGDVNL